MKDIQVTLDTYKKFTGNIFMIDNIPEISIGGNENGDCEFTVQLMSEITLQKGTISEPDIDGWDVYLTSVFIGGYKMEQLAQPGSLFDNRYRWDGDGSDVAGGSKQFKEALGVIDLGRAASGASNLYNSETDPTHDVWLANAKTKAQRKDNHPGLATQSMLYRSGRKGGYMGLSAETGRPGVGLPILGGQTAFSNESIQAFVISIKGNGGTDYMPSNSFVGAYPRNYKNWLASRNAATYPDGIKSFGWTTTPIDDLEEGTTGHKGTPGVITGGIVLMNNQKQRNDGFESTSDATNQPEDKVNASGVAGNLTVQDYVPFIYDERENNPIYLTTLNPGDKVSKLTVKITDQNGDSIWGPAHFSQMKNRNGIDANPPTNSRRIIIKLTYKPRIKNKLEQAITDLNKNIERLINSDYVGQSSQHTTPSISKSDPRDYCEVGRNI